jgi:hypothetical protein
MPGRIDAALATREPSSRTPATSCARHSRSSETELERALCGERSAAELRAAVASADEETDRLIRLAENLLVIACADQGALPTFSTTSRPGSPHGPTSRVGSWRSTRRTSRSSPIGCGCGRASQTSSIALRHGADSCDCGRTRPRREPPARARFRCRAATRVPSAGVRALLPAGMRPAVAAAPVSGSRSSVPLHGRTEATPTSRTSATRASTPGSPFRRPARSWIAVDGQRTAGPPRRTLSPGFHAEGVR